MGLELNTELGSSSDARGRVPVEMWSEENWPHYAHQLVPFSESCLAARYSQCWIWNCARINCVCARRSSTGAICSVQQATAAVSLLTSLTLALLSPLLLDWRSFETIRGDFDKWLVSGLKELRTDLEESAARRVLSVNVCAITALHDCSMELDSSTMLHEMLDVDAQ
eukprot:17667-Heterococcus_DN1.PRE.4